jgi:hypothetical protein
VFNAPVQSLRPSPDLRRWNWFEMRFRGTQTEGRINGVLVTKQARRKDRDVGRVGVRAENSRVAIRRLEVEKR